MKTIAAILLALAVLSVRVSAQTLDTFERPCVVTNYGVYQSAMNRKAKQQQLSQRGTQKFLTGRALWVQVQFTDTTKPEYRTFLVDEKTWNAAHAGKYALVLYHDNQVIGLVYKDK